jgi:hypothetical protein
MPLPTWMPNTGTTEQADTWNGKQLTVRAPVHQDIHYRIYNRRDGALLSFGTTNMLDAVATDILRTRTEHPHAILNVVQVDGPAYPDTAAGPAGKKSRVRINLTGRKSK